LLEILELVSLVFVIGAPLIVIFFMAKEDLERKNKAKTVTPKKTEVKE
jgi:hypothetical protein